MYGIEFSSKWALVEKCFMKYVKVTLGQSPVDFSYRNPNLAILILEDLRAFLEESWSALDKMMNITSKCWCWLEILKFDCMWVTVDFWPSIVDFQTLEQFTEKTCSVRHEFWHGHSWGHIRDHRNHLEPFQPKHLGKKLIPNWRFIA